MPAATPPSPAEPSPPTARPEAAAQLAAVDLGSNSFHLVIACVHGEELSLLDRVRDQVQLARGLGKGRRLSSKARARALDCLVRFRQRLRHVAPERIRAVGTSTLRYARDAGEFLADAEAALGHPIEVVSGAEEARLIYLGVAHSLADDPERRLVIDIGGGSTECILGERFDALAVHSLPIGCVRLTNAFFPKGAITAAALDAARWAAQAEVQRIERAFREAAWAQAVGASGTIRAVEAVLRAHGWSRRGITAPGLRKLRKAVLAVPNVTALRLKGLKEDRAPVFPAGLAILQALFDRLDIRKLRAVSGALREGVLYDLLGRIRHEDVRERTIRSVQERYRVDTGQAARVERTASALLAHAPASWDLDAIRDGRVLTWAARLHEIGLAVSWSGYQRHGAYLLANADLPGFSRDDQELLAAIVGCHRRKLETARLVGMRGSRRRLAVRLILLLRLAVLLHRPRAPDALPVLRLVEDDGGVRLRCPARWLAAHPLTRLDLARERRYLRAVDADFDLAT